MSSIPLHLFERACRLCDECILRQRPLPCDEGGFTAAGIEGLDVETLNSIFRQRYQIFIKRTAHLHRHPEALRDILDAYFRGERIAAIARKPEVNFSPYLLARIVIESILDVPKGKVGEVVKSPESRIPAEHARLREELRHCIEVDEHCSPGIDKLRAGIGDAHEELLMQLLADRGIPFADEEELRRSGYAKTPDAKLDIPIGIRDPGALHSLRKQYEQQQSAEASPSQALALPTPPLPLHLRVLAPARIVHWIDSKGMFGDPLTHRDNLDNQLLGYVNRFGPGLVIYWFGYVEEIREWTPPDIMIASRMPDEFVFPGDNSSSALLPIPPPPPAAASEVATAATATATGGAGTVPAAPPVRASAPGRIRTPRAGPDVDGNSVAAIAAEETAEGGVAIPLELEVAPLGGLSPKLVYKLYSSCGLLHLLPLRDGKRLGKEKADRLHGPAV